MSQKTFHLEHHPHVALCDLLKLEGCCDSGGAAKQVIEAGLVTVNGVVELRKRCKIVAGQSMGFAGTVIQVRT